MTDDPIELSTSHRCVLGELTSTLAASSTRPVEGKQLAVQAKELLDSLRTALEACCLPVYLRLAPAKFSRELQLPIASDEKAGLDTRVLLWPVSARDGEHPHADGWAAFMAARGKLAASERRGEERLPERDIPLWRPEVLLPEDGVRHHIHNRGNEVGLTIHIFGA